jgi:hypothetical protein
MDLGTIGQAGDHRLPPVNNATRRAIARAVAAA